MENKAVFKGEDLYINYDKWNKDNNILWITGRSGTGKTTVTELLCEEKNANNIEIDTFHILYLVYGEEGYNKGIEEGIFGKLPDYITEYIKDRELPDLKGDENNLWEPEVIEECDNYMEWLIDRYSKEDNLYIEDGMMIFKNVSDLSFLSGRPVIIKNIYRFIDDLKEFDKESEIERTPKTYSEYLNSELGELGTEDRILLQFTKDILRVNEIYKVEDK